jgi:hypothetical protein
MRQAILLPLRFAEGDLAAMKNLQIRLVVALLLSLGLTAITQAQTTGFTYQGKLSNNGNPANATYDMQFKLFDALSGGTQQGDTITNSMVQVSNGIFTVELDFTASVFTGESRFLEIAVRLAGDTNPYTVLAPRQPLTTSPYAIRTLSATAADSLSDACVGCVTSSHIQSVDGSQISGSIAGSQISGTVPVESVPTGSGNYIQNSAAALKAGKRSLQQEAGFNVDGDGVLGGTLGVGTTPTNGITLDVLGITRITTPVGNIMQFGTPSFGTGMSIIHPTAGSRADLRFNRDEFNSIALRLVAGDGTGPPPDTNGIAIDTFGRIGIGSSPTSLGRLTVEGDANMPGIYSESPNRGVYGKSTGSSYGVYGESINGIGMQGVSSANIGVVGSSSNVSGVYGNTQAACCAAAGVLGVSTHSSGVGVKGQGQTGVYGVSSTNNGNGVTGESNAVNTSGVYGTSTNGIGVSGQSTNGVGVSGAGVQGVTGFSAAPNGYGVYGNSTGFLTGIGVYGENLSGIGVYGKSGFFSNTYAGYFDGNVRITSNLMGSSAQFSGFVEAFVFVETSDRNAKANFAAVDMRAILQKVASLPIQKWNFKNEPDAVRHIGPMAQDFRAAFSLGTDDKHIATVDADGVALAAIQGLYQMMLEKDKQIRQLQRQVRQLQRSIRKSRKR